ncbi:unnamed protein product [Candida verbasci]|uniref:Uncharacterized protein n=1 Tax=Candida verbasci TaxID=1227364 RepID=A0A9W4XJY4_9ASCO|nr:unnamed protein product [Candida verbasci]
MKILNNPRLNSLLRNWEYKLAIFVGCYFLFSHIVLENTHNIKETGLKNHLKVIPEEAIEYYDRSTTLNNVEKLAYMQYATNYDYLNLAIINFIHLRKSNTQIPNLVIIYDEILQYYASNRWTELFQLANSNQITLISAPLIKASYKDDSNWAASFTKFHIFNQDQFHRIVYFDSDSMLVNTKNVDETFGVSKDYSNLDELFKLPNEFSFVLPQAYWLNNVVENKSPKPKLKVELPNKKRYTLRMKKLVNDLKLGWPQLPSLIYDQHKYDNPTNFFANHIMVIKPSKKVFNSLMNYVNNPFYWSITNRANLRKHNDYDMEIFNKYLNNELKKNNINFGIIPHRVYGVLSGEFGEKWHERFVIEPQYLPFINKHSNKGWEPLTFFKRIKLIHFSDNPIPKPWEEQNNYDPYNSNKIYCVDDDMEKYNAQFPSEFKPRLIEDCDSVRIWNWFRDQFSEEIKGKWLV